MANERDQIRVQEQNSVVNLGGNATALRTLEANVNVIGSQASPFVRVQAQNVNFLGSDEGLRTVLRVEDMNVVVIAGEGELPDSALEVNAFQYDLDGHIMYGLHVRGGETHIYDLGTGQWSIWNTASFMQWNAQYHIRWRNEYYAASQLEPTVLRINPDSVLDDSFRINTFRVTGRMESQSRRYLPNPEAHLFGSVGLRGGDVVLSYSDDEAANFRGSRTVTVPGADRDMNVVYYNMGGIRSPGRVYRIEDEGSMRRIQSLRVKIGTGDEDA